MEIIQQVQYKKYVLQLVRFRKTYQIFFLIDNKITDIYTTVNKRRANKKFFELEEIIWREKE